MSWFVASDSITRTVMYEGNLLVQYGLRCVLCQQEWWPARPAGNSALEMARCWHKRETKCPLIAVVDAVVGYKRDVFDFYF